LRLPQVADRTGKSESTIIRDSNLGLFPKPIKIGIRSIGWIESEVDAVIEQAIAVRDAGVAAS
jgi:prophage regulatory protein